ncbi:MAG: DUF4105 domain-containing protein, partial [Gemmatimonadales bacterium]
MRSGAGLTERTEPTAARGKGGELGLARLTRPLLLLAGMACALRLPPTAAQQPSPSQPSSRSSSSAPAEITVYLMTFGPGRQVWERFGHNAIWIHDPARGTDESYNYGLFDFHQENFLLRFVQGQMWYWMAGFPAQQYVAQYERDNRSIWIQELELPARAKVQLEEFLR